MGILFYFLIWKRVSNINDIIKKLTKKCARLSVSAQQDTNPIIAVLEANYSAAYLSAIKEIADDSQFKLATSLDFTDFENNITNIQDTVTQKLLATCTAVAPDNASLLKAMYGSST